MRSREKSLDFFSDLYLSGGSGGPYSLEAARGPRARKRNIVQSRGNSLEGTKVNNRRQSKARRGSIPLILLIVLVLGIGASASLFLTQGTQRVGKHEELTQKAWFYAQAAVEEVLVKLTNVGVEGDPIANKVSLQVPATQFMGAQNGVHVTNPYVHFRVLEAPEDPARMRDFLELQTAGPSYASEAVRTVANGGDANIWWQDYLKANPPAYLASGALLELIDRPVYQDLVGLDVPDVSTADCPDNGICVPTGKGKDFVDTHWANYRADGSGDNADQAAAMEALQRLTPTYWHNATAPQPTTDYTVPETPYDGAPGWSNFASLPAQAMDNEQMRLALNTGIVPNASGNLSNFLKDFNTVMVEMADEVDDRFAGCGDDVAYAVGAYISGLRLGASPDNNQDEEEEDTEAGRDSGALAYSSNLVTIQAQATAYALNELQGTIDPMNPPVALGTLKTSQPVTAHRLVSKMSMDVPMKIVRDMEVIHLIHHYRLMPLDMAVLGWISVSQNGTALTPQEIADLADWSSVTIAVSPRIHLELNDRWPDAGKTKVVPFQAATCLSKNALG